MNRRSLIGGLAVILAMPAVIRTPGLLMQVRPVRMLRRIVNGDMAAAKRRADAFAAMAALPPEEVAEYLFAYMDRAPDARDISAALDALNNRNPFLQHIGADYA